VDRYALRGKAGAEDGVMGLYKAGLYFTCLELSQVLGIWCFSAFNAEFGVGFALCHPGEEFSPCPANGL
jgi:hypothetical protein